MKPDFIGLGAPKAATTWLFHQLRAVPGLHLPVQKELHFFCDWKFKEAEIDSYRSLFESDRISGEISVNYLESDFAREKILEHCPDAKLFAIIRNPVDLAYSYYWHLKRQNFHCGFTQPIAFNEAFLKFNDRFMMTCCQGTSIKKWLAAVKKEQLMVLTYDELTRQGGDALTRLVAFLLSKPVEEVSVAVQSTRDDREGQELKPAFERIYPRFYQLLNDFGFRPLKHLIGENGAHAVKERLQVRKVFSQVFFGRKRAPMTSETRSFLISVFSEEFKTMEDVLGIDLQHWRA